MVVALPCEEQEQIMNMCGNIRMLLNNLWLKLGTQKFNSSPRMYAKEIGLMTRQAVMELVQEIIYDKERENVY